ncbi:conserved hypothetical protein [Staphylococcus sp. 8AQ]|nr:hypothetical protein UF70_0595 [Staphylococcus pasteuri]VXC58429.1 conserved hypothetical protein [Staphylococcus sp. 8AQ]
MRDYFELFQNFSEKLGFSHLILMLDGYNVKCKVKKAKET